MRPRGGGRECRWVEGLWLRVNVIRDGEEVGESTSPLGCPTIDERDPFHYGSSELELQNEDHKCAEFS